MEPVNRLPLVLTIPMVSGVPAFTVYTIIAVSIPEASVMVALITNGPAEYTVSDNTGGFMVIAGGVNSDMAPRILMLSIHHP